VCPSNDTLLGYFERRLRPRRVQQIAVHLDECEACRTILVILMRDRRMSAAITGCRSRP
jgi:hypothetical protein